jgi:hypothetical protein
MLECGFARLDACGCGQDRISRCCFRYVMIYNGSKCHLLSTGIACSSCFPSRPRRKYLGLQVLTCTSPLLACRSNFQLASPSYVVCVPHLRISVASWSRYCRMFSTCPVTRESMGPSVATVDKARLVMASAPRKLQRKDKGNTHPAPPTPFLQRLLPVLITQPLSFLPPLLFLFPPLPELPL